jgi:prolyl-tRNA synthetase
MIISKMLGERIKTVPSDAQNKGHINLLRAGYIKQVANGIYSLLPPAKLAINKIENIMREEMNKIGGQEVLMPVVMPRELWEESGRYTSIGDEMARFKDRTNHDMLLGMTHEEAAVHLARNIVTSYSQLPFMIYQIQTKFRDEPRARGGLIRVREFTMKDGYSFHETQADLNAYYDKVLDSYMRIFKRIGMRNYVAVASDTGMMGGSGAHEFMLLNPIGEDTIVLCPNCDYKANMEVATCKIDIYNTEVKELKEVETGDAKTIDEVGKLLNVDSKGTCKAVCYADKKDDKKRIVVFIRGDLEVNESKLKKVVGCEIYPLNISPDDSILHAGNIGPYNLGSDKNMIVVYDKSIENEGNEVVGANKPNYHFINFNAKRDLPNATFVDVAKVPAYGKCEFCGETLTTSRGVEIGNIFKLGTKYTETMNMKVLNKEGKTFNPIMGCYGIGVGRALGCVAEESSDDKGLVWPMTITPFEVYLAPLSINKEEVKTKADEIYKQMLDNNIEVLYDDRNVSTGCKFADSELMGMPIRVCISPRTLENQSAEITMRATGEKTDVKLVDLIAFLKQTIQTELDKLNK